MELDVNLGLEVEMGKVLDAEEDLAKVLNIQVEEEHPIFWRFQ